MHITFVQLHIRRDKLESFMQAMADNQVCSMQEPGNLRFDVLQDPHDPTRIMIYEAYDSAVSAAAHKETPHYLTYAKRVRDCFASPREARSLNPLWIGPVVQR